MRMNARFEVAGYHDDFGNTYRLPFKIAEDAPKFTQVAQIGFLNSNIYVERKKSIRCLTVGLFEPRHLKVTFFSGRSFQYPVPRPDLIDDMVEVLKPGLIDEFIPGTNDDEAACIELVGERWTYVPPATLTMKQSDFRSTPLNAGNEIGPLGLIGGDFQATPGKTSYSYKYSSDVPGVGTVNLRFAIQNDSDLLHECQLAGMTDWKEADNAGVCNATSLGISARHFVIQANAEVDTNFILPGGNRSYTISRKVPVSGIDGNFVLPGSERLIPVAKDIADCAQCLSYQGESVKRVDLLVS